jgi:hypothetical protein
MTGAKVRRIVLASRPKGEPKREPQLRRCMRFSSKQTELERRSRVRVGRTSPSTVVHDVLPQHRWRLRRFMPD